MSTDNKTPDAADAKAVAADARAVAATSAKGTPDDQKVEEIAHGGGPDWVTIAILFLWAILLLLVGYAAWIGLQSILEQTGKIVVAIIAAAAVLLGAILTHALNEYRERYMGLQKQKQENYLRLINMIAEYVRDYDDKRDAFETAYFYSWLVGSPAVVAFTKKFMKDRKKKNLELLLRAMRKDLGLRDMPKKIDLGKTLQPPHQTIHGTLDDE